MPSAALDQILHSSQTSSCGAEPEFRRGKYLLRAGPLVLLLDLQTMFTALFLLPCLPFGDAAEFRLYAGRDNLLQALKGAAGADYVLHGCPLNPAGIFLSGSETRLGSRVPAVFDLWMRARDCNRLSAKAIFHCCRCRTRPSQDQ